MTAFSASAPGKVILFGEHAVVYGEPAIAAPLDALRAKAIVTAVVNGKPGNIQIEAPDISLSSTFDDLESDHPLRAAILTVIGQNGDPREVPSCRIQVSSSVPARSGLGSGAAVAGAIIRALSAFLGNRLSNEQVSQLIFEVEKIHHGTPSGIDNTVIAFQRPIYYQKDSPVHFLKIPTSFNILIADSGIRGRTRDAVELVRRNRGDDPETYTDIFHEIGELSRGAKHQIQTGSIDSLGPLMNQNHHMLQKLGISHPVLDNLVNAARGAGALGAKLSGGGLGGNIIVLGGQEIDQIARKLVEAGARTIWISTVKEN